MQIRTQVGILGYLGEEAALKNLLDGGSVYLVSAYGKLPESFVDQVYTTSYVSFEEKMS